MRTLLMFAVLSAVCLVACADEVAPSTEGRSQPLSLVVMDPLAAPLSCPCVQGYAQRQYDKLAEYLTTQLGRPVHVTFAESFEKALAKDGCTGVDIAIGKDSVVRHDAAAMKLTVTPLAQLTGKDGQTTQHGLIVVRTADPAKTVSDLRGYRFLFGKAECDEKFSAARQLLTAAQVELPPPEASETMEACSDGACKIVEWGETERAAAVISSYAAPLLEGCGTIKKGDLRVIAETKPVPFITAFATNRVDEPLREKIQTALIGVSAHPDLLAALETLVGFVPIGESYRSDAATPAEPPVSPAAGDAPAANATSSWPGWRGTNRDAQVAYLPETLPKDPHILWRKALLRPGLGGIAATDDVVILGDRDVTNEWDEFRCYAAADGALRWTVRYLAPGHLDFDNTPRATPLIHAGRVFLLGAFGQLTCAELDSGITLWQMNLFQIFDGDPELVWGASSSPLIVDGKLIVNPGGPEASIVALDPSTGEVIWQSPGDRHAYSSFIVATLGGVRQLVGYDRSSLGGWDIATGDRLWTLKPPHRGDFNVPTPVADEGRLMVTSENNRARLYEFDQSGKIVPEPVAINGDLAPEISTPVIAGRRVFCVCGNMVCLALDDHLRTIWTGEDAAFCDYSPLFATNDRVLAIGRGGELLLVDAGGDMFQVLSRVALFSDPDSRKAEVLSHPALVGNRLYLRGEKELVCVDLAASGG